MEEALEGAGGGAERLPTASLVELRTVDPTHRHARFCLGEYFAELDRRFEAGFDPAVSISAAVEELRLPAGLFVVAVLRGEPVGCGALKFHGPEPTELKRMWVARTVRGLGIGSRLLGELEARARAHGATVVRLETNRSLTEAMALYRDAGYREVDPFNDEPYAHHWFEKRLAAGTGYGGSRCTVSGEKAGRHTATYSAPSANGEL